MSEETEQAIKAEQAKILMQGKKLEDLPKVYAFVQKLREDENKGEDYVLMVREYLKIKLKVANKGN